MINVIKPINLNYHFSIDLYDEYGNLEKTFLFNEFKTIHPDRAPEKGDYDNLVCSFSIDEFQKALCILEKEEEFEYCRLFVRLMERRRQYPEEHWDIQFIRISKEADLVYNPEFGFGQYFRNW